METACDGLRGVRVKREGKVVSASADKVTTTCHQGKEHCHTVAKDAKITCDGQASKAADLKAGDVKTVNGANFTVAITGGKVTVNGANVTTADIAAKNGTIHVLDAVLLPAGAIPAPAATTTATLVGTR